MAQPYVGEIRMFAGNFAPAGWEFCEGQLLSIREYETLFQLIGVTYGGDGQSNFRLPDLRGRLPMHQGTSSLTGTTYPLAQSAGTEGVALSSQQLPVHAHRPVGVAQTGTAASPANALTANSLAVQPFINDTPDVDMAASAVAPVGGSQPHTNLQPALCVNFIISLYGIYPSPT